MTHTTWMERATNLDQTYDFSAPKFDETLREEFDLIQAIAGTAAFKRLKEIRFLGALDYALVKHPNGSPKGSRYTRAQHSLGVAALAQIYLQSDTFTSSQRKICLAAAMLHDIGHAPFSHTLEPTFHKLFGIDHHATSIDIISGQDLLGIDLARILRNFGINAERVIEVLSGDDQLYNSFFSGPINFDTIEGILRSGAYFNWQRTGLTPSKVIAAATAWESEGDIDTVDRFWETKNYVYNLIIRSQAGVLVDKVFQEIAMQSQVLDRSDFLTTESSLYRKIPNLRAVASAEVSDEFLLAFLPKSFEYVKRDFYVDRLGPLGDHPTESRYKQRKSTVRLTLR